MPTPDLLLLPCMVTSRYFSKVLLCIMYEHRGITTQSKIVLGKADSKHQANFHQ